jgi:hypothetical protein
MISVMMVEWRYWKRERVRDNMNEDTIAFNQATADLFVPNGHQIKAAMSRTTHLGVGAHQDDLEFMALHGILAGFQRQDRWFGGVTVTDGGGSARDGAYATYSDAQMRKVRRQEQRAAAVIGQYSFMAQLDYASAMVKTPPASDCGS